MLSPDEIEKGKLPRATVRGYKPDAVREHLRRVAWDYRQLLHDHKLAKAELERVQRELQRNERREELESGVLDSAQQAAKEIRETGRREAELIVKKAREHADALRAGADRHHAARARDVEKLQQTGTKLRQDLRSMITSILSVLEPAGSVGAERRPVMEDLQRVVESTRAAPKPTWGERLSATYSGAEIRDPADGNGEASAVAVPDEGSTGAERVA